MEFTETEIFSIRRSGILFSNQEIWKRNYVYWEPEALIPVKIYIFYLPLYLYRLTFLLLHAVRVSYFILTKA